LGTPVNRCKGVNQAPGIMWCREKKRGLWPLFFLMSKIRFRGRCSVRLLGSFSNGSHVFSNSLLKVFFGYGAASWRDHMDLSEDCAGIWG